VKNKALVESVGVGLEMVRNSTSSRFALVTEEKVAQHYLSGDSTCDLMIKNVPQFSHFGYGIAHRIGSPYISVVDQAMLILREKGFLFDLEKKWFGSGLPCFWTA